MQDYALPNGFRVNGVDEADSDWNGYPVPILNGDQYAALVASLADEDSDPYVAEYVEDGKVPSGYYADGLQWERVDEDEVPATDVLLENGEPIARGTAAQVDAVASDRIRAGVRPSQLRTASVGSSHDARYRELMASPFPLGRL